MLGYSRYETYRLNLAKLGANIPFHHKRGMISDQRLLFWLLKAFVDVVDTTDQQLLETASDFLQQEVTLLSPNAHEAHLKDEDVAEICLQVARNVFNDASIVSFANLSALRSSDHDTVCNEMLEDILIYAVTSFECPNRELFVHSIMDMDSEIQNYLMELIKARLQPPQEEEEEEDECALSPECCQETSTTTVSPVPTAFLSPVSDLETMVLELRNVVAAEKSKLVDVELVVQEKDRVIAELETKLATVDALQCKLADLNAQILEKSTSISALQDQIDVHKEKAEKFDALEKSVVKLKEKLTDLQEVRQQLKIECENHSRTYNSLIEAEQELDVLRPFRAQVEDYRTELAEKSILIAELQAKLQSADQEIKSMQHKIQYLEEGKQAILSSQSHLASELMQTSEQLRATEKYSGIGEQMSEFNPLLMQELSKLKAENHDLLGKLDRTSLSALDKLQKELADTKAVNKSLQDKWITTKQALEDANQDIDQLRKQLLEQSRLYAEMVQTKDEELAEAGRKRKRCEEEYEERIKKQEQDHLEQLETLEEEHESALEEMESAHQKAIEAEHHRLDLLQADLDQEIVKRRKVERLKKAFETDLQRQRMQMQNMTSQDGSNAGEFDVAAKEIRSLQEKLDEAYQEIQGLKTQLAARASGSSGSQPTVMTRAAMARSEKENEPVVSTKSLLNKPLRILGGAKSGSASHTNASAGQLLNYAEQAELHDKHIEQLAREKRELLSKSLEENKEKMELSQRVMTLDKENAQLKAELRKRTLEKERLERNLLKSGKILASGADAEC